MRTPAREFDLDILLRFALPSFTPLAQLTSAGGPLFPEWVEGRVTYRVTVPSHSTSYDVGGVRRRKTFHEGAARWRPPRRPGSPRRAILLPQRPAPCAGRTSSARTTTTPRRSGFRSLAWIRRRATRPRGTSSSARRLRGSRSPTDCRSTTPGRVRTPRSARPGTIPVDAVGRGADRSLPPPPPPRDAGALARGRTPW